MSQYVVIDIVWSLFDVKWGLGLDCLMKGSFEVLK